MERSGLDHLVKGMHSTGIGRAPTLDGAVAKKISTKDFIKRNLYGYGSTGAEPVALENVRTIFAAGLERRRREAYQLGYGDDKPTLAGSEPPAKRRRFQRRNSKTPAMLLNSFKVRPQALFEPEEPMENPSAADVKTAMRTFSVATSTAGDDDADWDDGLEIAESLVKQLQKRRMSDVSAD